MRITSSSTLALVLLVSVAAACGAGSSEEPSRGGGRADAGANGGGEGNDASVGADGSIPSSSPLRIDPADAKVTPPDGQNATVKYKVFFKPQSGAESEVTPKTNFSVEPPDFGWFTQNVLTVPAGTYGTATIHAAYDGEAAITSVTVTKKTVVIDPSAPADAPTKFGGATDASAKPSVLYPASGIVVPPNLNTLELHWIPAPGQTLFEIDFQGTTASFAAYTACKPLNGGCVYTLGSEFWATVADQSRGTSPVTWHVRGVDGANPGAVGTSDDLGVSFTNEDLLGGLYYWNTAGTIIRYDFGLPNAPPQLFLTATNPGNLCVGCHAVSRDGTRIVGADGPIPSFGPYVVWDVATRTPVQANGQPIAATGSSFFSFSPDSSKLLLTVGSGIFMRDLVTGVQTSQPVVPLGSMPDWSPDGKEVVFAQPPSAFEVAPTGVGTGSIVKVAYDGASVGAATTLVPTDGVVNNYYPAYSPDQGWIAFNRSMSGRNSYANDVPDQDSGVPGDGTLWVVPSGGGQPTQLLTATGTDPCSWAKWTPSVLTYDGNKPIMFLTYTSEARYGLRLVKGAQPQLWMASFDPAASAGGQDGSHPAIWLPFQDITSGNRIAQWVTKVQRKSCVENTECAADEKCENGTCLPAIH